MQTVFSPLAVVGRLANGDLGFVRRLMREEREALHRALDAIAQTLAAYGKACLDAGADGIFFATVEWATYDAATAEQYAEFGRPYDLRVLAAAQEARLNVLHVCRKHNMAKSMLDYPVHAFNWATNETDNPSLSGAGAAIARPGGVTSTVSEDTRQDGDPPAALREPGYDLPLGGLLIPPQTPRHQAAIAVPQRKLWRLKHERCRRGGARCPVWTGTPPSPSASSTACIAATCTC
jgi:hypothetical protein